MTTEVRETEQKYEVEGDVALPSLADLPRVAAVSEPEWHLKLPDAAAGTAEKTGLVRAHARDASLRPVARIETRRRLTTLLDATGASLAEMAVDGGG